MKREIIRLEDVYKIYEMGENKVYALSGINLSVKESEFLVVLGPSGSGKSTMMNLIGCLDTPTKGRIFLDEYNISHLGESELAQIRGRKIGFIFQQFNLIPSLTAKENIILPMSFQTFSEEEQEKKALELLKLVQLEGRQNHYPKQLSGGEQQRIAIARSLVNDPEVILADEPTGNLDSKTGQIVLDFLEKLHKNGKTIVVVTHDMSVALKYAERICWIKDGKIEKVEKRKK